jgi:hypothetical protein
MVCELWTCGAIGRAPGLGDLIDADGLKSAVWRRSDILLTRCFLANNNALQFAAGSGYRVDPIPCRGTADEAAA